MAEGQARQPVLDWCSRTDGFSAAGDAPFITPMTVRRCRTIPLDGGRNKGRTAFGPPSSHTIVNYLEEFQSLLTCGDYLGV